jgi:hypothetical protein
VEAVVVILGVARALVDIEHRLVHQAAVLLPNQNLDWRLVLHIP